MDHSVSQHILIEGNGFIQICCVNQSESNAATASNGVGGAMQGLSFHIRPPDDSGKEPYEICIPLAFKTEKRVQSPKLLKCCFHEKAILDR